MKLFFFSILFLISAQHYDAGVTSNQQTTLSSDITPCEEIYFSIMVEESDEKEFNSVETDSLIFKGNEIDSAMSLKYNSYRAPLEILTQSRRIILENISPDYEDRQQNYFDFGYNEKLNKHLVYVTYYESGEFLLIDDITAHIDTLNGSPHFSPNLKKVFSFYVNPYGEREINGKHITFSGDIEISILCNNVLKYIQKKSYGFIPIEIKWKDNNTLLIKAIGSLKYDEIMSDGKKKLSESSEFIYKSITITKV